MRPAIALVDCSAAAGAAAALDALAAAGVETATGPPGPGRSEVRGLLLDGGRRLAAADLESLPRLEIVATASAGADHIDLAACAERGVLVANAPAYCAEEVADSTLAMLLDLLRGVTLCDRAVGGGTWSETPPAPTRRVAGVRLGLVGHGEIGGRVGERARALGMEVWAAMTVRTLPAAVRSVSLRRLLRECDAISLHVPLCAETRGLIGAAQLASMRSGALLVNTARGELVDTEALLGALDRNLGGAALDVLPQEPPASPPRHPRLLLTSHVAWWSREAVTAAHLGAAQELVRVLGGRPPRHPLGAPGRPT